MVTIITILFWNSVTLQGSHSWDSSGMVTKLLAGQCGVRFPAGNIDPSCQKNTPMSFGAHPSSCSMDSQISFPPDKLDRVYN